MKDPSSRHICGVLGVVLGGDGVEVDFGGKAHSLSICCLRRMYAGCMYICEGVCVCYSLGLFALAHCVCCLKMHAA